MARAPTTGRRVPGGRVHVCAHVWDGQRAEARARSCVGSAGEPACIEPTLRLVAQREPAEVGEQLVPAAPRHLSDSWPLRSDAAGLQRGAAVAAGGAAARALRRDRLAKRAVGAVGASWRTGSDRIASVAGMMRVRLGRRRVQRARGVVSRGLRSAPRADADGARADHRGRRRVERDHRVNLRAAHKQARCDVATPTLQRATCKAVRPPAASDMRRATPAPTWPSPGADVAESWRRGG
jgi:hypothetical protein